MDLLLYLVRKHEVAICELPIAEITRQYLEYLSQLQPMDVNEVGDFVEVASRLIEIKSRHALPSPDQEETTQDDPREQLVTRLLGYKRYRDVASILEEQSLDWQQSYSRLATEAPSQKISPEEQPIREVELWDLVSALGRVLQKDRRTEDTNVVYDDVPIQTHMRTIYERICSDGKLSISETLSAGMQKSTIIGIFLAVLELVRHHSVEAEQDDSLGEIWVKPGPNFSFTLELAEQGSGTSAAPQTATRTG